ncbi:3086_t:CDS:2, partial [Scutellospora calospora]
CGPINISPCIAFTAAELMKNISLFLELVYQNKTSTRHDFSIKKPISIYEDINLQDNQVETIILDNNENYIDNSVITPFEMNDIFGNYEEHYVKSIDLITESKRTEAESKKIEAETKQQLLKLEKKKFKFEQKKWEHEKEEHLF